MQQEDNVLIPLLREHRDLPFDTVQADMVMPALEEGLKQARDAVAAITQNADSPTFANTVEALEASDEGLDRISSVFYHLLHVQTSEELQAISRELPPKLSAYRNDVLLNPDLFQRLEAVASSGEALTPEQEMVLEDLLSSFRRNGASLSETDQERLRELDRELSTCAPRFAEHVLKATQKYALWVTDGESIAQVPASAKAAAREAAAKENRKDAWKFTLDAPSYLAFMTYAEDATLREQMWRAYSSRCVDGELDNSDLIRTILELRYERARLLGYTDHVAYTLEQRMVKNRETLEAFYEKLLPVALPAARRDLEEVRACKESETGEAELFPWDMALYSEKLRQQKFDLKQEELRPWFEFDATLEILFRLIHQLFDLGVERVETLPVYRDDVRTYRVFKQSDGSEIGHLLIDPFPRPEKRPGAWMNALLGQGLWQGKVRRPVVGIVANLSPPSPGHASLLTMEEARTLFHEFGHALHELLSQCRYRSVAGTRVRWDFVELPSQLMENWLLEPEFLRTFPKHVETGEPLPEDLIGKIQASKTFLKGYQCVRQMAFGRLDLAWHSTPTDRIGEDLGRFEHEALGELQLFPRQEGTALSHAFQHIFSGGYASGYYSYKWAEVLEADVFELFQEQGLFDPETAARLETEILSKGGSRPPEDLFRNFRGREPDPDALLRRDGLLT